MKSSSLSRLGLIVALALTALIYWPGTHGTFLLDDYPNIVNNPAIRVRALTPSSLLRASLSSESGPLRRPLAMVSFALNEYFTGLRPRPMKITNLAIHLLNGLLIFVLLRRLLGEYARSRPESPIRTQEGRKEYAAIANRSGSGSGRMPARSRSRSSRLSAPAKPDPTLDWLALAVTAAWLMAPINLTAVLYVVQRMSALAATFTLLGLISYLAARRRLLGEKKVKTSTFLLLAATPAATLLATLTKENGALTLLYAFLIEWVLFGLRRADGRRSPLIVGYFTLLLLVPALGALGWLLPSAVAPGNWATRSFDLGERLLSEGRVLWHYLYWTILPDLRELSLYHDAFPVSRGLFTPWTTLAAWVGIAALLVAGLALRRRQPLVSLGILWFLAGQTLTAGFIPLELVFEHREYLASLGLFLAVLSPLLLARPRRRLRPARIGIAAMIVLLYGCALSLRSLEWSNPLRQAAIAARRQPESPRATYGYGRTLAVLAGFDPAFAPAARAQLQAARRVSGQTIIADSALILLAHERRWPIRRKWFADMMNQLRRRPPGPEDISALNSLVHCTTRGQRPCRFPAGALDDVFASALRGRRPNGEVMAIYGDYLLNGRHKPEAGAAVFRALVNLSPDSATYHFSLGVCEAAASDPVAASAELATLKRLNRFGMNDPQIRELSHLISKASHDPPPQD